MERRLVGSSLVSVFTLSLLACGGGTSAPANAPAKPPAASTGAASTGAATTVAKGEFGVPECDEYMSKYLACIDSKVPESARVMVRQGLDQTKAQWKQAASTPEGRTGLAMACKQATDAAKTAMSAYGCSW